MSRRHSVQSADGVAIDISPTQAVFVVKAAAPSNVTDAKGYSPGCLWVNKLGTTSSVLYVNQGTVTAAAWLNLA